MSDSVTEETTPENDNLPALSEEEQEAAERQAVDDLRTYADEGDLVAVHLENMAELSAKNGDLMGMIQNASLAAEIRNDVGRSREVLQAFDEGGREGVAKLAAAHRAEAEAEQVLTEEQPGPLL